MLKEIYSLNEELIKKIHEKAETAIQRNVSKRSLTLKYRQDLCMAVAGDLLWQLGRFLIKKLNFFTCFFSRIWDKFNENYKLSTDIWKSEYPRTLWMAALSPDCFLLVVEPVAVLWTDVFDKKSWEDIS